MINPIRRICKENMFRLFFALWVLSLAACATRPINQQLEAPVAYAAPFGLLDPVEPNDKTVAVLAFSGGGTRAAAFSYGVLETLRDTTVTHKNGASGRLIDRVDVITGVSGGSFTALAYRLYGEKLFDVYEQDFLKRDIQGELIAGVFNPGNWGDLLSDGWGRSEMAANLYDQVLFKGATFGDLKRTKGPAVVVSSTDIETGTRILFDDNDFKSLCTDLDQFRLARAAAASSAVPVILSPLTINNYAGSCGLQPPDWVARYSRVKQPPRAAVKAMQRYREIAALDRADNPYLHLVDGGVSDNLGLRAVIDAFNEWQALREAGYKTRLDHAEKIVVFIVNSLTEPKLGWNKREDGPGLVSMMIQAAGVPIDHYSGDQVNVIEDLSSRWQSVNDIKNTPEFKRLLKKYPDMKAAKLFESTPNTKVYVVNVAFSEIQDKDEREYLYNLPTSFSLEPEQVDRLRSSARKIILNSPTFKELLQDENDRIIVGPGLTARPTIE